MEIQFYKYHGTGNDFILLDNRNQVFEADNTALILAMCDRHFGIGADGLILLEESEKFDFSMRYFNADGREGSMCGNGGRCITSFAKHLNIIQNKATFEAIDGKHEASIDNNGIVSIRMNDVATVEQYETHCFVDTGSPHHILMVAGIETFPVFDKGREIRYAAPYYDKGSNVNFVEQINEKSFKIRTYERGVENETLSCGTGVTAVAIAMHTLKKTTNKKVLLETLGGQLEVSFSKNKGMFSNVQLKGPTKLVFKGVFGSGI